MGAQRTQSRLSCYLDVLTPHTREGSCTHIILPSVSSDDELYLQSLTENEYDAIQRMKERNSALKILLGLELKSSRLKLMSANEASVGSFIQTLLTYLKEKRLDGLDVIWLDGTPSDTELFTDFLKSIKGVFEEETRPLLLSASVKEPTDKTVASYDEQILSQYVDFISILPAQLQTDGQYISKTAQHWQDKQVDLQKLGLVMPGFLQRSRHRHHHRNHPKHDDTTAEEGKKDHVHLLNLYLGDQVCQAVKSGQLQFITLTSVSDEQSPIKEVLQQGFGGIGVVLIDLDVFGNSMCPNMTQKERATVESKAIMHSHHGHRRHGHGDHRHHHTGHHTRHHDRHHDRHHGRHHHGRHHHGHRPHHHGHRHHGRHHHHHHHHSTTTQSSVTQVTPKGME